MIFGLLEGTQMDEQELQRKRKQANAVLAIVLGALALTVYLLAYLKKWA